MPDQLSIPTATMTGLGDSTAPTTLAFGGGHRITQTDAGMWSATYLTPGKTGFRILGTVDGLDVALAIVARDSDAHRDDIAADRRADALAGMRGPDGELGTDVEPEQFLDAQNAAAEAADVDIDPDDPYFAISPEEQAYPDMPHDLYREILERAVEADHDALRVYALNVIDDMQRLVTRLDESRRTNRPHHVNSLGELQATAAALNARCGALDRSAAALKAYDDTADRRQVL